MNEYTHTHTFKGTGKKAQQLLTLAALVGRTHIQFPAPSSDSSQLPVRIPASQDTFL